MLLLVVVSIWIFKKFRELGDSKGYPGKKWGTLGVVTYLGVAFSMGFIIAIIIALGSFGIDIEATGVALVIDLIGYALGGLASYILFQSYGKKENKLQNNIEEFGKEDEFED